MHSCNSIQVIYDIRNNNFDWTNKLISHAQRKSLDFELYNNVACSFFGQIRSTTATVSPLVLHIGYCNLSAVVFEDSSPREAIYETFPVSTSVSCRWLWLRFIGLAAVTAWQVTRCSLKATDGSPKLALIHSSREQRTFPNTLINHYALQPLCSVQMLADIPALTRRISSASIETRVSVTGITRSSWWKHVNTDLNRTSVFRVVQQSHRTVEFSVKTPVAATHQSAQHIGQSVQTHERLGRAQHVTHCRHARQTLLCDQKPLWVIAPHRNPLDWTVWSPLPLVVLCQRWR